jgi:hypothetical protein
MEEDFSELLEQLPEKGWIKLVRSPTNNNKWWCKYEAEEYKSNEPNLEAWGENIREALKGVLKHIKESRIIT